MNLEEAKHELTERQLTVFQARLDGHSFRQIALALNLHEATVRGHWEAAIRRLTPQDKDYDDDRS